LGQAADDKLNHPLRRLKKSLLLIVTAALIGAVTASAEQLPRESQWVVLASRGLDSRVLHTLPLLHGAARQLLALRAYLRAGDSLAERWSWTPQQLASYGTSNEGRIAAADISAVELAFARANAGYSARANRMPRSLETQVTHWNENAAVASVAGELQAALERQFPAGVTPQIEQLRAALIAWRPVTAAPLAAPGLSPHGQGRAFDFQIEQGGRVVAGCEVATAHQRWDQPGWTDRLHAAVLASGKPFVGPLPSPYEPWHYAYAPDHR
jgi:hypothetical protein